MGAFLYTQPIILANKAAALSAAVYKVLPGCVKYDALLLNDGILEPMPEGMELGQEGVNPQVFAGYDDQDKFIGFAVTVEEPGFQDIIVGIFGYDPLKQEIIGLEILDSKETPGLGDKILKDAAFRANFTALATHPEIKAVKKGEKGNPYEVEAITGATISSKAVVRMLNKGIVAWEGPMKAYAETKEQIERNIEIEERD
ncbi:MAG: FMN-binding protein [Saprospirales bacterium]|nr:FMN-binding protein [Saprospirales bacterium]